MSARLYSNVTPLMLLSFHTLGDTLNLFQLTIKQLQLQALGAGSSSCHAYEQSIAHTQITRAARAALLVPYVREVFGTLKFLVRHLLISLLCFPLSLCLCCVLWKGLFGRE